MEVSPATNFVSETLCPSESVGDCCDHSGRLSGVGESTLPVGYGVCAQQRFDSAVDFLFTRLAGIVGYYPRELTLRRERGFNGQTESPAEDLIERKKEKGFVFLDSFFFPNRNPATFSLQSFESLLKFLR
ncbi:hypothetical protein V8G54_022047 [Vigna mungo]|uniref:Uncharacterized protein n=1 Tax=Vigna mungo TaxID=3915 RepID=A0AAQ3RY82_VIGMU